MTESPLLTIGAFARLADVSTATLRHYDRFGLLAPAVLDPRTGYRLYTRTQLPRLYRIATLRELGFSLSQIAILLTDTLPLERLHGMFAHQQQHAQGIIAAERARLARLAARLRQIDQEGQMPAYDIRTKYTAALYVVSLRDRVPHLTQRGPLERELATYLRRHGIVVRQPTIVLVHSHHELYRGALSIDVEVGVVISAPLPTTARVQLRPLPRALVASTVHVGDEPTLHAAYVALLRWLDESGQHLVGPPRQVQVAARRDDNPLGHVTEVQFPIRMSTA